MRKGLVYFLGVVTGVALTIAYLMFESLPLPTSSTSTSVSSSQNAGVSYFEEGQVQKMEVQRYQVDSVLPDGSALASSLSDARYGWYMGPTVLLLPGEDFNFYDQQKVSAPKGRKFFQVGTFRYKDGYRDIKTVPVVALR